MASHETFNRETFTHKKTRGWPEREGTSPRPDDCAYLTLNKRVFTGET